MWEEGDQQRTKVRCSRYRKDGGKRGQKKWAKEKTKRLVAFKTIIDQFLIAAVKETQGYGENVRLIRETNSEDDEELRNTENDYYNEEGKEEERKCTIRKVSQV